ncbi:MAG: DinB family protein [Cyanobacteriota bacterium]|nr:DinB family protein [Cyanobacteriota bacterium]
MNLKQHFSTLTQYHFWAFQRLYEYLESVSETDYRRECGLFFKSIHGTLNHSLLADKIWHGRCINQPFSVSGLDEELCSDRKQLETEIKNQSAKWSDFLIEIDADKLGNIIEYRTTEGSIKSLQLANILSHVVNHGTHHRGQVSAALTQFGYPASEIDLPYFIAAQNQ